MPFVLAWVVFSPSLIFSNAAASIVWSTGEHETVVWGASVGFRISSFSDTGAVVSRFATFAEAEVISLKRNYKH